MTDAATPATPPPVIDDAASLASFPVVTDALHNLLIAGCAVGAAFGFWNGSTALGFTGLLMTVAANMLSNVHVHKMSGIGKVIVAIQNTRS